MRVQSFSIGNISASFSLSLL